MEDILKSQTTDSPSLQIWRDFKHSMTDDILGKWVGTRETSRFVVFTHFHDRNIPTNAKLKLTVAEAPAHKIPN